MAGFSGQRSVLSFWATSFMAFAFIRKRDVFFSGFVILMYTTYGQKTRYGLPQPPSVEQYLWVDSRPVEVSKREAWLVCMKVRLSAS